MSTNQQRFRETSFIKAKLFQEPVYRSDDNEAWIVLRNNLEEIRAFFRQIGQEVTFDEGEGTLSFRRWSHRMVNEFPDSHNLAP